MQKKALTGVGVTSKIALGRAYVLRTLALQESCAAEAPEEACERLRLALEESIRQTQALIRQSQGEQAEILSSHLEFLQDPAFNEEAYCAVRAGEAAEAVITRTVQELVAVFSQMDDAYMRERSADINDIGQRILRNLMHIAAEDFSTLPQGTVLVAKELVPSQTVQLSGGSVVGFITELGGLTSHTAIIANAMQLPAVVGCGACLKKIQTDDELIVDAANGMVLVNPTPAEKEHYRLLHEQQAAQAEALKRLQGYTLLAPDGRTVQVEANIGSLHDATIAHANGADGIGLFRTELLFLARDSMPDEEAQYSAYSEVARLFDSRSVTIRTLDVGGDKPLSYLPLPHEDNPFLGVRAIRLCKYEPMLLKTQLRAILRASAHGKLRIMFPMIAAMEEWHWAHALVQECKQELRTQGIAFDETIPVGMMIETPAAAICADDFAQCADFFSIGTNDLTQYTLAIDRGNERLAYLNHSMHPAVQALIRSTISAAHRHGIDCCLCGELASVPEAAAMLLEAGLDTFSVGMAMISEVKQRLLCLGCSCKGDAC